jgi:hypothetical protein
MRRRRNGRNQTPLTMESACVGRTSASVVGVALARGAPVVWGRWVAARGRGRCRASGRPRRRARCRARGYARGAGGSAAARVGVAAVMRRAGCGSRGLSSWRAAAAGA